MHACIARITHLAMARNNTTTSQELMQTHGHHYGESESTLICDSAQRWPCLSLQLMCKVPVFDDLIAILHQGFCAQ